MAGLGRKVFTAGDVLTASDVQNYLMDQTVMNFAGTAARSSAIATPTTGMTTYNQTTQQLETYNGSAYVGMSGLQLIKKQTIGSAVSSVPVTGAFSATYDNYKIIISGGVGSTAQDLDISLTGGTSVYNFTLIYSTYASASVLVSVGASVTGVTAGVGSTDRLHMNCDVSDPFNAKFTTFSAPYSGNLIAGNTAGIHKAATSFTGFTITPSSGTLTGGTIYVYGYGI